jgi:Glycosyl hydrolases family 16
MLCHLTGRRPGAILDLANYELELEDRFEGPVLDRRLWIPYYLPHWSSRAGSAARYAVASGTLRLFIEHDQELWSPEFAGHLRVSSLQTGVFAGPVGSAIGQHRFREGIIVREAQRNVALYTPQYGLFELRARALDDPVNMVALWMIGYEDEPTHSAEICICEIFGRDVGPLQTRVGMGVHPFGDPAITDEFAAETVGIDARGSHTYAAEWTPDNVAFYVDGRLVKVIRQSPAYPMQFMLSIYEFADHPRLPSAPDRYPKTFVVERFRGYRPNRRPRRATSRVPRRWDRMMTKRHGRSDINQNPYCRADENPGAVALVWQKSESNRRQNASVCGR